jgi:hypothetical protein
MERIPLARGRWVRFDRPMYISDRRLMASVADMPEGSSLLDVFDRILSAIEPVIGERSWDGPLDQMTPDELQEVARAWGDQTEDDALPLDDATSSETSPQPGT